MGLLYEGGWARAYGQDTGRVMRLVRQDDRADTWLCQVVDVGTGKKLYRTDVRSDLLEAIDEDNEPLFFLTLEAIAGPYPYA